MTKNSHSEKQFLIITCGLTGTGKSAIASALSDQKQIKYLSSDLIRKQVAGVAPTTHVSDAFDTGIYSIENTDSVYDTLFINAKKHLTNTHSVIIDASFKDRRFRRQAKCLAAQFGARFLTLECFCPSEIVIQRLKARESDPDNISDGRWEIYLKQKEVFEKVDELSGAEHLVIDCQQPVEQNVKNIIELTGV